MTDLAFWGGKSDSNLFLLLSSSPSVSIVLSLPFAIFHKEMRDLDNTTICGPDWPSPSIDKGATLAAVMTSYVIPLAAIIACYSRILLHLWRGGSSCSRQSVSVEITRLETYTICIFNFTFASICYMYVLRV